MTRKTHISIKHISKVFPDGTRALHDINLDIAEGEILVLLGPSGCGKSTLLRTIGGLEQKSGGDIYFYNKEVSQVPVEDRNVGFVFQNYALFPTMTVRENIAFGLKLRKMAKAEISRKVDSLLEMMELVEHAEKKPRQLSGGQQQRVAIARVLAIEPEVLLLDEPLTALDAKLKEYLRVELGQMLRKLGITAIYVTHDQLEAMSIADRIAVMNLGVIEQVDTPERIYSSPKTDFVADFIGRINCVKGKMVSGADGLFVDLGFIQLPAPSGTEKRAGDEVNAYLRPEDIELVGTKADNSGHIIQAIAEQCIFMGDCYHVVARAGNEEIFFEVPNGARIKIGETVQMKRNAEKLIVL